jgi:hypothetical protein
LGYPATVADLDLLRASPTADYLLQAATLDGAPITRLFHQALADELLAARNHRYDEHRLLTALVPTAPAAWATAGAYAHSFAAEHAAAGGRLGELLSDPDYPTTADLPHLLAVLPTRPPLDLAPVIDVLRFAAHRAHTLPPRRRQRLYALAAAHLGHPAALTGHTDWVSAVAMGRVGDHDVIISGGGKTMRVWGRVPRNRDPRPGHHGTSPRHRPRRPHARIRHRLRRLRRHPLSDLALVHRVGLAPPWSGCCDQCLPAPSPK